MKSPFKKLLLLPVALLLAGLMPLWAQEGASRSFTLEECIEYGIENNVNVRNERLNQSIAKAQIGETRAQGLPQINAGGELTHNVEIPVQFVPGAFLGLPEGTYAPLQFGVPYQSNVNVSASQLIFNGSYFVGLRAAKVYKQLAEKSEVKAEIDVAEGISLAYFGALVAEERAGLLQANLQRLDSLYRETRAMNEQGFAERIDVQRVLVNLNNVRTEYENVQRSLALNQNMLKFQMGLPLDTPIELSESISDFQLQEEPLQNENFTYEDRIEYQQLEVNRQLAELDIRNNIVQYYPTVSAFANLGYNAGKPTFKGLFDETPDIPQVEGQDTVGYLNTNTWNRFVSVGVRVNVPIFDGLLKSSRVRRTRLVKQQVVNQIQNLERSIDLEVQQVQVNLTNQMQSLRSQQENMELAEEVFRVAKIKYQEGVGSNLEVVEAENALKTAETNYFVSLYEALVARVAYQKATGTLIQQ